MSDSFLEIPEPSLPEHNLLQAAGTLPELTSGFRERVVLNVHQQVRYGRWVERAWVTGNIVAACFVVLLVWNFRWTKTSATRTTAGHRTRRRVAYISYLHKSRQEF